MGDLISRQALCEYALNQKDKSVTPNDIIRFPSAQPEIIYCKYCKYYIPYEWMFDGLSRSSNINDYTPDEIGCAVNDHNYPPEGFCSNAERRED